ncbi:hypothetical protein [Staphylococcus sp. HMSC34B12]|uniref:hypothetical protein n=1 Tax=Staphylococcus sp. HMSC34B12 TaxID=1608857 RepID=UPI0008A92DB7|nr:hypothetical protein [Staphylococcus sp. HMSC34B12]OHR80031.1 hypothetical protein HMPREF3238_01470 [Staphylococcus sp. HMSC34B12]
MSNEIELNTRNKIKKKSTQLGLQIVSYIWSFKLSIIIIALIIFVIFFQKKISYKPALITGHITLFVLFFKIELDNYTEKRKQKSLNRRLILAHLIDLYDVYHVYKNNPFHKGSNAGIGYIDEQLQENPKYARDYREGIMIEFKKAVNDLQSIKNRQNANDKVMELVKSILTESDITLSGETYNSLSDIEVYFSWSFLFNTKDDEKNLSPIIESVQKKSINKWNNETLYDNWQQYFKYINNIANRVIYENAVEESIYEIINQFENERKNALKKVDKKTSL